MSNKNVEEITNAVLERLSVRSAVKRWKILFMTLLIVFILYVVYNSDSIMRGDYIARINVEGVIDRDDIYTLDVLKSIRDNDNIKAVLLRINSPGGSVGASESLYRAIKKISSNKPVVVLGTSYLASGGYIVALGGNHIVSYESCIIGSIGVVTTVFNVNDIAEKIGVKFSNYSTSPLKLVGNPTQKHSKIMDDVLNGLLNDEKDFFISVVEKERNMNKDEIMDVADASVYIAKQAVDKKLIDEVGDEDSALEWLYNQKNIPKTLSLVDIPLKKESIGLQEIVTSSLTKILSNIASLEIFL